MYYQGILKPPIKLIGAKTRNRRILYSKFPAHRTYIEPFFGTGGVLLGKPKSELEIINDFDPYVVNFYKYVQRFPTTMLAYLQKLMEKGASKELFLDWRSRLTETNSPYMKACLYYLVNKHCFNGIVRFNEKGECNSSWGKEKTGRGIITKDWMNLVSSRMSDVFLFCSDAMEFIENVVQESPGDDLFMFVDPPYRNCQTVYRGKKFTDEDHIKLKKMLEAAKFKWMLTLNDDQFVRELYKDFNIFGHSIQYNCANTTKGRGPKPEVIITNYVTERD